MYVRFSFFFSVMLVHMSVIYCHRNGDDLISFKIKNNKQKILSVKEGDNTNTMIASA